jgi:hypothetical protein
MVKILGFRIGVRGEFYTQANSRISEQETEIGDIL